MNYIYQIRAFYDQLPNMQLSSGQIALWHALMDLCNRSGWALWFGAESRALEAKCRLSREGLYKARAGLKKAGLLEFECHRGRPAKYRLTELSGGGRQRGEGGRDRAGRKTPEDRIIQPTPGYPGRRKNEDGMIQPTPGYPGRKRDAWP